MNENSGASQVQNSGPFQHGSDGVAWGFRRSHDTEGALEWTLEEGVQQMSALQELTLRALIRQGRLREHKVSDRPEATSPAPL